MAESNAVIDLSHHNGDIDLQAAKGDGVLGVIQKATQGLTEATGRWPGIYRGSLLKRLLGTSSDPELANCRLWLSQYAPTAVVPVNWPSGTIWQSTDRAQGPGPCQVAVVGRSGRDKFNGTVTELTAFRQGPSPANVT